MTAENYIKLGKLTALISFLIGTIIFISYFITSNDILLFIGYAYILVAGLINLFVLTLIFNKASKERINRKKLIFSNFLILLNIPIMIFYCWIAIMLLNTMRITFTNATNTELTDINIVGCETKHIDKLEANETETVWVGITGDCSININYLSNGTRRTEDVVGYVTNMMGQIISHKLGGENNIEF